MSFCRFAVDTPTQYFLTSQFRPTGWFHAVLNYIGPNDGEGIRLFLNGAVVISDTTGSAQSASVGNGRIVVGRIFPDRDQDYTSVQVDELIYFNAALTIDHVQSIYNSA